MIRFCLERYEGSTMDNIDCCKNAIVGLQFSVQLHQDHLKACIENQLNVNFAQASLKKVQALLTQWKVRLASLQNNSKE